MAEAIFNHCAAERGIDARAASAGTVGAGTLNPTAVQVIEELGVSMAGHVPKQLSPEMVSAANKIVSMGCGVDASACPTRFMVTDDWGLDDPAGQPIEQVRKTRDEICRRVDDLLGQLGARQNLPRFHQEL
jgi:protein-tyrosine-phosphatase